MSKLKPQLIITGSNKKKSSFAGGIGYFLLLAVVFVLGVYVGMRLDSSDLDEDIFSRDLQSNVPEVQGVSDESKKGVGDIAQDNQSSTYVVDTSVLDTSAQPKSESKTSEIEDANLEINSSGPNAELKEDASTEPEQNETTLAVGDSAANDLPSEDSYRLQVAAFGNLDDANEFVSDLKLKGYDAYIVTTTNSRGEVWSLIKVGNFKTTQEAWNFSTIYRNKEGGEAFVESLNQGRVYREPLEENNIQQ